MIDILNLEWTWSPSRDREASTLVCNYLRYQGFSVAEEPIHNGFWSIAKYQPKLVYISNIIGAKINFDIALYCKSKGIILITGISEGDIKQEYLDEMIWGHNKYSIPIEDKLLLWSKRTQELFIHRVNQYKNRIAVTGNPGSDRYIICNKEDTWIKDKEKYKLVVGIGCWAFDSFLSYNPDFISTTKYYSKSEITRFSGDRDQFSNILYQLIRNLPDVLFILKKHPGGLFGDYGAGIEKAKILPNTITIKNERSILECLSVSDIWMSYESNTALEAWLMGIPTGLLNPSGVDFPCRSEFWKGQPNFSTFLEWKNAIKEYLESKNLPKFDLFQEYRKKIIENTIQWADGLNHVRSGNEIIKIIQSEVKARELPSVCQKPTNLEILKYAAKHYFNQTHLQWDPRIKWNRKKLRNFTEKRMLQQLSFYQDLKLNNENLINL